MRNDRVPDPVPPRSGLTIQDAGAAVTLDHHAPPLVERAASADPLEPAVGSSRPTALRLALSPVPVGVERHRRCSAGDDHSVASDGVPVVLALEVALLGWAAKSSGGD